MKTLSKFKSGQYPVWMTWKPRKGDFKELKSKKFPGGACPRSARPRGLHPRRSFWKLIRDPKKKKKVKGLFIVEIALS